LNIQAEHVIEIASAIHAVSKSLDKVAAAINRMDTTHAVHSNGASMSPFELLSYEIKEGLSSISSSLCTLAKPDE
jgi:DNA-binding FrmR family transcriptional regulator